MDDEYQYYQIEYNEDGWLLNRYNTWDGFDDNVDSCSWLDMSRLQTWQTSYDVSLPSWAELGLICQDLKKWHKNDVLHVFIDLAQDSLPSQIFDRWLIENELRLVVDLI